jgi:hypothetical protein
MLVVAAAAIIIMAVAQELVDGVVAVTVARVMELPRRVAAQGVDVTKGQVVLVVLESLSFDSNK